MNTPEDILGRRVLPPAQRKARRILIAIVIAFVAAVAVVPQLITFATDLYWFREIGFDSVFVKSLTWRIALFAIAASFAIAMFYGNLRFALSGRAPMVLTNAATGARVDISGVVRRFAGIVAAVIALVAGTSASTRWMVVLQELHGVASGVIDPLFGRDISFYMFRLPAIETLLNGLTSLTMTTLVAVVAVYVLSGALTIGLDGPVIVRVDRGDGIRPPRGTSVDPRAARHIGILVALMFLLVAVRLWLVTTAGLLYSTSGPLVGAGYTDVHVRLPAIRVSAIVAFIGAITVLSGAFRGKLIRSLGVAIVAYAIVGIVGRGIIPAAVQRLSVTPNELVRETPYLQRHLAATRAAWGLDSITTRDLSGDAQLSLADIRANGATIENVRLWERDLVQQTFSQLQEIRTYYDFVSVTDDRYTIDGRYRQVHLAAREVNAASLPTRTFINEHLTFTHGMGITMAPVNQVTPEGLPVLFFKDLPPVSTTSLKLTRPQIYYGELTDNYVFVGTGQEEFDYPAGDANIQTKYSGTGGVPVGSLVRRLLYAWQFRSLKILLSNDISGAARIMYRRDIEVRAKAALPFLGFDTEPYLIVTDAGELKWILDAYTGTSRYPYAQRTATGVSYMRNSVKVVIDAYNGTVDAYNAEPNDPIIKTAEAIFPDVFKPISAMPADIRKHVRFPGDLFRVQAALQTSYHMLEPETFYHREDQWQIPTNDARDSEGAAYMRHIILRLPGEKEPEFIYMTPFTPRGKDNLAAWMVARMDGDHYGEMIVYRFPKQSLVYGPKQVANRINQDTDISRQLALWDQRGSQVIRGELLVIPIEESLIYVQPIFTRAEGGTIPELKRVVVTHGSRVVMGETLESALSELFGGESSARTPTTTPVAAAPASATNAEVVQQAQLHYDRAMAAQRAGNWAEYGREIELLGQVLRRLQNR